MSDTMVLNKENSASCRISDFIPRDHPLRTIARMTDWLLNSIQEDLGVTLQAGSNPTELPLARVLKAQLLMGLYNLTPQQLCRQLGYNLLLRWFMEMGLSSSQVLSEQDLQTRIIQIEDNPITCRFFNKIALLIQHQQLQSFEDFQLTSRQLERWVDYKHRKSSPKRSSRAVPRKVDIEPQAKAWENDICEELQRGNLKFPTILNFTFRLREIIDNPESNLDQIASIMETESKLAEKAVRMANLYAFRGSKPVDNVSDAVRRIGLSHARCLAFAVAAEELIANERYPALRQIAKAHWAHTMDTAASAYVIAVHSGTTESSTAMMAGLLTNIAEFYLMDRIGRCPEFVEDMGRFVQAVCTLRVQVRESILQAFHIPDAIASALPVSPVVENASWPLGGLHDIICLARASAGTPNPFTMLAKITDIAPRDFPVQEGSPREELLKMLQTVQDEKVDIIAALHG